MVERCRFSGQRGRYSSKLVHGIKCVSIHYSIGNQGLNDSVAGQSTECIVHGNNTEFTVTANISSTVETCQPWGLRIKGGNPPYNVSFAQLNSPIVTNVTIPASMNGYTYINRATPNFPLIGEYSFTIFIKYTHSLSSNSCC